MKQNTIEQKVCAKTVPDNHFILTREVQKKLRIS